MESRCKWRCPQAVLLGWFLLLLHSTPCLGTEQESPLVPGNPGRGRDVFIQKGCLSCHTVRGSGGKVGPDLAVALVGKGTAGIAAAMLSHYPAMSAAMRQKLDVVPILGPEEMDDIVAYLAFIGFAREPGSVENGHVLFSQKGCIKCHAVAPGGVSVGPPLGRASLAVPPILVAQEMWNHGTQMDAKMQQLQVQRSRFEGREMVDLLAFLSGPAEPLPDVSLLGDPVVGWNLYQSKGCARCHLRGETGKSVGPDFSTGSWYKTATEIAGAMWNHQPAMWKRMVELNIALPRFEGNEMADVITYLYLLRSTKELGDPLHGREVFTRGHCTQCHEGGGPGPVLATVDGLDTPIHLAAAMWNHGPRMHDFLTNAGMAWPTFEAGEVRDLVAFLRYRKPDLVIKGYGPGNGPAPEQVGE